jgi:hypothetical protein
LTFWSHVILGIHKPSFSNVYIHDPLNSSLPFRTGLSCQRLPFGNFAPSNSTSPTLNSLKSNPIY